MRVCLAENTTHSFLKTPWLMTSICLGKKPGSNWSNVKNKIKNSNKKKKLKQVDMIYFPICLWLPAALEHKNNVDLGEWSSTLTSVNVCMHSHIVIVLCQPDLESTTHLWVQQSRGHKLSSATGISWQGHPLRVLKCINHCPMLHDQDFLKIIKLLLFFFINARSEYIYIFLNAPWAIYYQKRQTMQSDSCPSKDTIRVNTRGEELGCLYKKRKWIQDTACSLIKSGSL